LIAPKSRAAGLLERLGPLRGVADVDPTVDAGTNAEALRRVDLDDVLDALAAMWTAERVLAGTAVRLPENPPVDDVGLRMEMWA
jgi:predicted RNase H-like nuclease